MIVLLYKRNLMLFGLFCCFFIGMAAVLWNGNAVPVFSAREDVPVTVVIDPGHGGEDGGAVSPSGIAESRLNLEVSLKVHDLLCFAGQRTVLTRSEDVTICDDGLDTMRQPGPTGEGDGKLYFAKHPSKQSALITYNSWGASVLESNRRR